MTPDRVFVTGANSFLGATLVRQLIEDGCEVLGLVRPDANDILLQSVPYRRVTGDLLQPDSYRDALAGCQTLYHVAASYTQDPAAIAAMEQVNGEGTRLVLTAAIEAGVCKLVHTSTIGTIGQPEDGRLASEETRFNLSDPSAYVRSKLAGERIADDLGAGGAPIVIVHPTAMLGPGDWRPTASGRRVLDFLAGRVPRYLRGGINWCPVADVARGMVLASDRGAPGRHYILGHHHGNLDLDDFMQLLSEASGVPAPHPPRPGLFSRARASARGLMRRQPAPANTPGAPPERLTCDPTRAIGELAMPQSDLQAAARAEIDWYRQHGYA